MRSCLGCLNVVYLMTQLMDVTTLLASNIEYFLRKLVVQSLLQCDSGVFVCFRKVARASQVFIKQA